MSWLPWVVGAPLAGATLLFFWRGIPPRLAEAVGVGSVALSALCVLLVGIDYLAEPRPYTVVLWHWIAVGEFSPRIALYLDGLSLTMIGVVSGVGTLIHLFAGWYMRDDPEPRRFFAYMNLFVAAMLLLVLGDSLLSLYFGWEGVGLCSYLLIGFWYRDPANGLAARKAFITTRVGDTLMAIGLFLLFRELGTLDIQEAVALAGARWDSGAALPTAIALLLLGGAVGKSAQLPLQTWLPDAMAGPTPVSALIHAATMVTAGVYLIARMHGLFLLAPDALAAVGWVGAITLLLAGGCALYQNDIKRILAYSTMSQIGYMFLALGVGAWSAAIFHLMTHAFFKALLFMASGSVILALHHEQDIFKMGGLRRRLPVAFWSFLIGGSALAAVPWITAGFWSKDAILFAAWEGGHRLWWLIGVAGAFLTSLYTFRLLFIVFGGEPKTEVHTRHDWTEQLPLLLLMVLSVVGGLIAVPAAAVLPAHASAHPPLILSIQVALAGAGIGLAWWLYGRRPQQPPALGPLPRLARDAWGFDWLYERLIVRPWMVAAQINRHDALDDLYTGLARLARAGHGLVIRAQTGRLRWYAAAMTGGLVLMLGAALWT